MNGNRLHSIDVFRGLAILGMVLANYLAGVSWISPWFKHAKDAGFTIIDLVAPMADLIDHLPAWIEQMQLK